MSKIIVSTKSDSSCWRMQGR